MRWREICKYRRWFPQTMLECPDSAFVCLRCRNGPRCGVGFEKKKNLQKEVFVWVSIKRFSFSPEPPEFSHPHSPFCIFQGHRKGWRAQQHLTCDTCPRLFGSSNSSDAATKTTTSGTREPRRSGGDRKRSQHGYRRVSTSVQKPTVELLDAQLPTRQKSVRKDRRSRWVSLESLIAFAQQQQQRPALVLQKPSEVSFFRGGKTKTIH